MKTMVSRLAGATLALCVALPLATPAIAAPVPAGATAPADPAVTNAVAALRGIATMRADFTQIDSTGARTSGVITLKRGGFIRFQYAPGYPMLIVADGRALTVFDTELKQMQRWPIGDSPLGALLDPRRDVARFGSPAPSMDPHLTAIAVRDRSHPEYGIITLYFTHKPGAPGGLELDGWVTQDAQNRRTVIRLSAHQYGVAVADDLFRITNPLARPHH